MSSASSDDANRRPKRDEPSDDPQRIQQEADLVRAREVLERTVRFLAHCAQDPQKALESEDPSALIQALDSIAAPSADAPPTGAPATEAPASEEPAKESRTFPLRRRRSA